MERTHEQLALVLCAVALIGCGRAEGNSPSLSADAPAEAPPQTNAAGAAPTQSADGDAGDRKSVV